MCSVVDLCQCRFRLRKISQTSSNRSECRWIMNAWHLLFVCALLAVNFQVSNIDETTGLLEPSPVLTVPTSNLQDGKQNVETIPLQGTTLGHELETSLNTDQLQESLKDDSTTSQAISSSQVIASTLSSSVSVSSQSDIQIQPDQSSPELQKNREYDVPVQLVHDSIKIVTSPVTEGHQSVITGEQRSGTTVVKSSQTTTDESSKPTQVRLSEANGESIPDNATDRSSESTNGQSSEVTNGQRPESTGPNDQHSSELHSDIKDLLQEQKVPLADTKDTLGVKDPVSEVKGTPSEVKEQGIKVTALNGQSEDLDKVSSGEADMVKKIEVPDGDVINLINTRDINSGLEFPHHGETMPSQDFRDMDQEVHKGTEFHPEIPRNIVSEEPKEVETVFVVPQEDKAGVVLEGEPGGRVKVEDDKEDEGGLTFNEWTQKILAEAEKGKKQEEVLVVADTPTLPVKPRKKKNYAAHDCGAKVLASNPEATNVKSVLNANKDDYLNTPCKVKKWLVVELCEPIQAHSVEIASLELFSSQPKKVKVMLSDRYPTKDWQLAGEFEMKDERTEQTFQIDKLKEYFAKYVRFDVLEHYGNEHFCPITKFRVLGVAVTDYEDDDSPENEDDSNDDEQDDMDVVMAGHDGKAKNLFESAKDTVVRIVKKVLNVEDTSENTSQNSIKDAVALSGSTEVEHNVTVTPSGEAPTSPCTPDANIPGHVTTAPDTHIGTQLPVPPEPASGKKAYCHCPVCVTIGQTNIVRMLDEDEQVETSTESPQVQLNTPTTPLDMSPGKSLILHFLECQQNQTQSIGTRRNSSGHLSRLCQFSFMMLKSSPGVLMRVNNQCSLPMKSKTSGNDKKLNIPNSVSSQHGINGEKNSAMPSSIKSDTVSATMEISTASGKLENLIQQTDKFSSIPTPVTDRLSSIHSVPVKSETVKISEEIKPSSAAFSSIDTQSVVQSQHHTSINVEATTSTTVLSSSTKPALSLASLSSESVATLTLSSELPEKSSLASSILSPSSITVAVHIDPTPTVVNGKEHTLSNQATIGIQITPDSQVTVATPPLSQSWAPDTIDVSGETSVAGDQGKQEASDTSTSTTIINLPQPLLVTIEASSSATEQASPLEPMATSEGHSSTDVSMDTSDLDDLSDDPVAVEEDFVKPNTTVIDDKVVMDRGGVSSTRVDDLNLVRVPLIPAGKRESAIMRLSNRIKVLEQNVSLSSRFLEELSRRYKKQSEDMMKMLNKTLARLANVTVEADVKNKLHEDEMYIMEKKVENLTAIIGRLTRNFEQLNKQVTDRQMIWTSIEILAILAMALFLHLRRHKPVPLPPELKSLIDKMPAMPAGNQPILRRNSLSGPATPSKKLADTLPYGGGGGLQRFCSETALASVAGRDQHRQSTDTSKQFFEYGKKKKKKKSKGAELKSYMRDGPGPSHQEFVSIPEPDVLPFSGEATPYQLIEPAKPRSNSLGIIGKDTVKTTADGARDKDSKGTKLVIKNPCKKLPHGGGTKYGHCLQNSRTVSDFQSGGFAKSHRRQKSLPQQYYSTVETVGQQEELKTGVKVDTNICKDFAVSKPKHLNEKRLKAFTSNDEYLRCYPENNIQDQQMNGHHSVKGSNSYNGFDNHSKAPKCHLVKSHSADTYCMQSHGNVASKDEHFLKQRRSTVKNDPSETATITNGGSRNTCMDNNDSNGTKSDEVYSRNRSHGLFDNQPCSFDNFSDVYRVPGEVWLSENLKTGSLGPLRKVLSFFKSDD
ncbi:SUN domain-containing ossification factor-like isoform X2 [Dreissena polymorpha]|uniref:SUN domain-containing ossification factor-like isoform X2 n=1 Tax=Dreissena polymorpha TaxID=45954 RepID=UPI002264143E|nr:SUN domain-containing ossification factor-like isoform X2 [Dreissena polymorpha]